VENIHNFSTHKCKYKEKYNIAVVLNLTVILEKVNSMNLKTLAYWLMGIGGVCTLLFSLLYLFKTGGLNTGNIDINTLDSFGSLIGGVVGILFSLAGVILIIQTLNEQDEDFSKQKIESRFFELLNIHRENVKDMKLKEKEGKSAVIWMMRELFQCFQIARMIELEIANPDKDASPSFDGNSPEYKSNYSEEQIINFSYLAFFFGCVEYPKVDTFREYVKEYDSEFVEAFISHCKENRDKIKEDEEFPFQMFNGHQLRLGHYFRHLYQTVTYVDRQKNKWLNYEEKYQYIKTLRAQLTTQEQVIFFFNSLSRQGTVWERSQTEENKKLITKYNFIKNIPKKYAAGIDLKKYYPNVKFEGEKSTEQKNKIEKSYK